MKSPCPVIAILLITLTALLCTAERANALTMTSKQTVMGTELEVTVTVADEAEAEMAFSAVRTEFERIEDLMSEWKETSRLSHININAGRKAVAVTEELFGIIAAAVKVSKLTDGAFDISWAAMHGLWDFRPGKERMPSAAEIDSRLPLIDYRLVELDPEARSVFLKKSGMKIGLGGIAKGYSVDRAMMILSGMGVENAIVRAGGDIRLQGAREDGKPWEVTIKHPRQKGFLARLPLTNISISTSGDYERFFIREGVLYHHIIDPRTGYPSRGCRSVTILAPDTMTSDALSTAVFVLGPDKGLSLVDRLNGVEAIIVDSTGAILTSGGIDLKQDGP